VQRNIQPNAHFHWLAKDFPFAVCAHPRLLLDLQPTSPNDTIVLGGLNLHFFYQRFLFSPAIVSCFLCVCVCVCARCVFNYVFSFITTQFLSSALFFIQLHALSTPPVKMCLRAAEKYFC